MIGTTDAEQRFSDHRRIGVKIGVKAGLRRIGAQVRTDRGWHRLRDRDGLSRGWCL